MKLISLVTGFVLIAVLLVLRSLPGPACARVCGHRSASGSTPSISLSRARATHSTPHAARTLAAEPFGWIEFKVLNYSIHNSQNFRLALKSGGAAEAAGVPLRPLGCATEAAEAGEGEGGGCMTCVRQIAAPLTKEMAVRLPPRPQRARLTLAP